MQYHLNESTDTLKLITLTVVICPIPFNGLLSLKHKDDNLNVSTVNYFTGDYFNRKIQLMCSLHNPKLLAVPSQVSKALTASYLVGQTSNLLPDSF